MEQDEIALEACDCPACGFSMVWRIGEDVDVDTRKIPLRDDLPDDELDDFLDFLNSLQL